jgi:hypothetical protein
MTRHPFPSRAAAPLRALGALLLTAALLTSVACSRSNKLLPYPHESVLSVLGELKIWLRSDPYREEPGRDLEGQNIYRATLARLETIDELTGPEYDDILAFARAECSERLADWTTAAEQFAQVAGAGTSLSEEAGIRLIWVRRFVEARRQPPAVEDLEDYLDFLNAQGVQFEQLRKSGPMFPYDAYIMVELERTQEQKAAFLFMNRLVIPEGAQRAIKEAEQLTTTHAASRRLGEHELMLAGFYEGLARDYSRVNPPQHIRFNLDQWLVWIEQAREIYARVAQRDGDPAKPEGQARLRAIEALVERTLQYAR